MLPAISASWSPRSISFRFRGPSGATSTSCPCGATSSAAKKAEIPEVSSPKAEVPLVKWKDGCSGYQMLTAYVTHLRWLLNKHCPTKSGSYLYCIFSEFLRCELFMLFWFRKKLQMIATWHRWCNCTRVRWACGPECPRVICPTWLGMKSPCPWTWSQL